MANTVRVYHGSKQGLLGPIRPISRSCCDFGRGFYLGSEPTQPKTLICRMERPRFYTCELDLTGLRVYRFEPTVEWAMFVAWNRGLVPEEFRAYYDKRFSPIACSYDVIVGKVANDRMVVVLDWFFGNFISDVGLIEALQALKLGDQYVCVTQTACDHVKIVGEETLSPIDCELQKDRAKRQREHAIKAVDRIRLLHRKDGEGFFEIMARETGVKLDAT